MEDLIPRSKMSNEPQESSPEENSFTVEMDFEELTENELEAVYGTEKANEYRREKDVAKSVKSNYSQWTTADDFIYVPASKATTAVTPGVYSIKTATGVGIYFERINTVVGDLIKFSDGNFDTIIGEIQAFWSSKEKYSRVGVYKRGYLLYGPTGSGKSSLVQLIIQDVIQRKGIVIQFSTDPTTFKEGLKVFRKVQPNTPIVVIFEDVDSSIKRWGSSEILNILDGVDQIDSVVFLATTNYPASLEPRMNSRPSRFDRRIFVGNPSAESRLTYFKYLLNKVLQPGEDTPDIKKWAKETEGFSMAYLKEIVISVCVFNYSYEATMDTLKKMKKKMKDSDDDETSLKLGFNE